MIPHAVEVPRDVLAGLIDLAEHQRLRARLAERMASDRLRKAEMFRGEATQRTAREDHELAEHQAVKADDVLMQARALLTAPTLEAALAHCRTVMAASPEVASDLVAHVGFPQQQETR